MCHSAVASGEMIWGTHTSLAVRSTGAARMEVETERRAAKAVMNFIVRGLVFVRGRWEVSGRGLWKRMGGGG